MARRCLLIVFWHAAVVWSQLSRIGRTITRTASSSANQAATNAKNRAILNGKDIGKLIRLLPPVTPIPYVMSEAVFQSMNNAGIFSAFTTNPRIEQAKIITATNDKATPASMQTFTLNQTGASSVGIPMSASPDGRQLLISSFLPFNWAQIMEVVESVNANPVKKTTRKSILGLIDCRSPKIRSSSYERAV